ncbi:actin-like protein 9, partial [Cricetulus griseus]
MNKNLLQEPCGGVGNKLLTKMRAVVIDMGSGTCKMGFAGQTRPSYIVTNAVGRKPRKQTTKVDTYFGEAAHICPELTL